MRQRSYEFYEVRTNLGRTGEELQCRGGFEEARRTFERYSRSVDHNQGAVYLCRVQVMEAAKADKQDD